MMGGIYKNHLPLLNLSSQPQGTKPDKGMGISNLEGRRPLMPTPVDIIGTERTKSREFIYRELDQAGKLSDRDPVTFNPEGPSSVINLLWHIPEAPAAVLAVWDAWNTTKSIYGEGNYGDGEGNAFLHAYLSYRLTEALGPTIARRFTDANEVKPPRLYANLLKSYFPTTDITREEAKAALDGFKNPRRDMKADLFNNSFGRRLFVEGLAKNRQEAKDKIIEAIKNGKLQVVIDWSGV